MARLLCFAGEDQHARAEEAIPVKVRTLGETNVGMKKTKKKSQGLAKKSAKRRPARKSAKRRTAKKSKPGNMVEARENISNLVRASSGEIATKVIEVAKTGALAQARYMFEVAGLYPATEATEATEGKPEEGSFVQKLLDRLGEPPQPEAVSEDDAEEAPEKRPSAARGGEAGTGEAIKTAQPDPAAGESKA